MSFWQDIYFCFFGQIFLTARRMSALLSSCLVLHKRHLDRVLGELLDKALLQLLVDP